MDKVNEYLANIDAFLASASGRITPNIILSVTMGNGFMLGLLTTGYLGLDSMVIFSFPFWLFIWQFVVICFFSSRFVELSSKFLNKFFLAAVMGMIAQWQTFGMYVASSDMKIKTIEPLTDHPLLISFMVYGGGMLAKYCFSGNEVKQDKQETKIDTSV